MGFGVCGSGLCSSLEGSSRKLRAAPPSVKATDLTDLAGLAGAEGLLKRKEKTGLIRVYGFRVFGFRVLGFWGFRGLGS